jgi:hypothetical protein
VPKLNSPQSDGINSKPKTLNKPKIKMIKIILSPRKPEISVLPADLDFAHWDFELI